MSEEHAEQLNPEDLELEEEETQPSPEPEQSALERLAQKKGWDGPDGVEKLAQSYEELERELSRTRNFLNDREKEVQALLQAGPAQAPPQPQPTEPPQALDALLQDPETFIESRVEQKVSAATAGLQFQQELAVLRQELAEKHGDNGEFFDALLPVAVQLADQNPGVAKLGPRGAVRRLFAAAEEMKRKEFAMAAKYFGFGQGEGSPTSLDPSVPETPRPRGRVPSPGSGAPRTRIPGTKSDEAKQKAAYAKALEEGDSETIARMLFENPSLGGRSTLED